MHQTKITRVEVHTLPVPLRGHRYRYLETKFEDAGKFLILAPIVAILGTDDLMAGPPSHTYFTELGI
jgi:hypothetical protein